VISGTPKNGSILQPTGDTASATNKPIPIAPSSNVSTASTLAASQPGAMSLANDLYAGRPVLAKVYSVLNAGDPSSVNAFLDKSGYEITPEGIQQLLRSTQPGPGFDIRTCEYCVSP